MDQALKKDLALQLYHCLRQQKTLKPLTDSHPQMSIEDAYGISLELLALREADGEVVVGKKIGVTSKAVQDMLNVRQPDFGYLTDKMAFSSGEVLPISKEMIQPRAEGEIAFLLKKDLNGPGITNADVLDATEAVIPCFEVVDSRIEDWKIKIQDTVADNASCGLYVLGESAIDPKKVDLCTCGMVVEKNGKLLSTGAGAAALDSPVNAVAWLANMLGSLGVSLKAGEVILSGSLVPLEPVKPGDFMRLEIGGIGNCSVSFV